jgi:acyl carrier protein
VGDFPELSLVLRKLEDVAEVTVDPDIPIRQLHVSSLDLAEWTVLLEEEWGIELEDVRLDLMGEMTMRALYQSVLLTKLAESRSGDT